MTNEIKSALDMLDADTTQLVRERVAALDVEVQKLRLEHSQRVQRLREHHEKDLYDAAKWLEAMTRPLIDERENIMRHLEVIAP